MEDVNVLSGGIELLYEMKENLLELEGYKSRSRQLSEKEEHLEKEIVSKEKAMEEEVESILKKRKQEIEDSFEEQVGKIRIRVKKVKAKKDKLKNANMSKRIKIETADLVEEKRQLKEEMKSVFRVDRIPRIFNHKFYYALFLPKGFRDIVTIVITIIVLLLLVPVGIYKWLLPQSMLYLVIDYFVTVVIALGSYFCIAYITKEKHQQSMVQLKEIRTKLALNQKKIIITTKTIRKDKDESRYGLEKFNNELEQLENEIVTMIEGKKKALVSFETVTKNAIIAEIKGRYQEEIQAMKAEYDATYEEQRNSEEKIKHFSLNIAQRYESYVGKHNVTLEAVNRLIEIMKDGNCKTISEGLICMKQSTEVE